MDEDTNEVASITHPEWEASDERERNAPPAWDPLCIGGSSAAAVLGMSPWESRLALYERLRGGALADEWAEEEKARLDGGRALEPLIAARVTKRYGTKFMALGTECAPLTHPADRRIVGHVDGVHEDATIAEFKMVGASADGWGDEDSDQVPLHYEIQCSHYMELAGVDVCYLYALRIPSWRLTRYILKLKPGHGKALLDAELAFLRMVDRGTPPDPADEVEARRLWFQSVPKLDVVADEAVHRAMVRRWVASQAMKRLNDVVSDSNFTILKAIQNAGTVSSPDGTRILSAGTNRVFDEESFRMEFPALAAQYTKLDRHALGKAHRAQYEKHMRLPRDADEATRPLRFLKPFNEAMATMVAGEAIALPFVPEIDWRGDATDGE